MTRILLETKFRFIGDTLLAVPALRAARAEWPDAHITLLTGANARALLQHNPYTNQILEFDPRGRDAGLAHFFGLVQTLRRARFDMGFVLNRSFHSALIPALAGIPIRAGFASEGRAWLLNRPVPYDPDKSEVECYFDVLRAVAPHIHTDPALALWLSDEERAAAAQMLRQAWDTPQPPARLIGIQPGASLPEKRWPPGRFAALADALTQAQPDAHIAIIGGPDERAAADAMLAACRPQTLARTRDFVGRCALRGSLALLPHLQKFVGGDTAILHSANALGVPTVALFGPTNPRKWGTPGPHRCILEAPSGVMDLLSVDTVAAAALELGTELGAAASA